MPAYGIMVAVSQDKPTSEQLRREVEKLRAAAVELKKHAATLLAESAELEKQISRLKRDTKNQSRKS
jgi:peptidoglycan hydrolase CwlO-like protein